MSGGTCQPLGQGEIKRANQPEGAIRNARPTANDRWGTASNGVMPCLARVNALVPCPAAKNTTVMASATAVDRPPLSSVTSRALAMPGAAISWRQGSSDRAVPPSAGR